MSKGKRQRQKDSPMWKKRHLVTEVVTDVKEKKVNSGVMHIPSGEPEKKCIFWQPQNFNKS